MGSTLLTASVWVIPVILAITLHEAAHGFVAWRLGDDTAKSLGRVSFNPLKHVDAMGTVVLPALLLISGAPFLFGWAKPVPINFMALYNPRRDMVLVAAAGPGINLLLAFVSAILIHTISWVPEWGADWLFRNLVNLMQINLVLAVFNMIPLPPLDGGRVAVGLLPRFLAMPLANLERFGLFIIIGALFLLPMVGRQMGAKFDILTWLVGKPVQFLFHNIAVMAGHG